MRLNVGSSKSQDFHESITNSKDSIVEINRLINFQVVGTFLTSITRSAPTGCSQRDTLLPNHEFQHRPLRVRRRRAYANVGSVPDKLMLRSALPKS